MQAAQSRLNQPGDDRYGHPSRSLVIHGQAGTESIKKAKPKKGKLNKDWNETLIAGGQVQPNMYPAKFSFNIFTASCSADFVVYPTGVAGAAGAANIVAYNELYGTNTPTETGCGSATVTVPSVYWAYNTGGMVTTSPIISEGGSQVAFIQSNLTTQSVTGCSVGYNFFFQLIDLVCTGGGLTSADVGAVISGNPNIPAGDTIASVTNGTTATLTTAATATFSGATLTLTAVPTNTASLVLLKWAAGTGTLAAPDTLTAQTSATNYRNCTAPCFYTVSLGANDTYSAPFYDYLSDDAIYVGDDSGRLHQITGVFYGTTIAETSPWPVTLNATYKTSSPVYDPASGNVFVGNIATATNAALYAVGSGNAGTTSGSKNATSSGLGDAIVDGTLVDPNTEKVYAFVTTNSAGNNAVRQFAANFASGTGGSSVTTGTGGAGYYFYSGTFDNVYYSSATGTAGNLWVMGNTGGSGTTGDSGVNLYRIPITATGTMGTVATAISGLTDTSRNHYGWPSPITEFCNNGLSECAVTTGGSCGTGVTCTSSGVDYIFFSVDRLQTTTGNCHATGTDGCVLVYSINTPTATPVAVGNVQVLTVGTPGCWSTSGIEVDNSVPGGTLAGASQIYTLGLSGNGAGGPTHGTYTSSTCGTGDSATPIAYQFSQSAP